MTQRVYFSTVLGGVLSLLLPSVAVSATVLPVDPSIEQATESATHSLQKQLPATLLKASSRPQAESVRLTKKGKLRPIYPKPKRTKPLASPFVLTAVPTLLYPNRPTPVKFSLLLTHPQVVRSSVRLERQLPNGQWRGLGLLRNNTGGSIFTRKEIFSEPAGTAVTLRVSAAIRKHGRRVISEILQLPVATIIQPGPETTITDPTGSEVSVTIPADALTREVSAAITPLPFDQITAELGGRTPDAAVTIVLDSRIPAEGALLTKPLTLRVPAPRDLAEGARVIVAQPILADAPEGGGLREQLLAVDTALVKNGVMVTQATSLPGVFGRGPVLFLRELGSGFVQGSVVDVELSPRSGVYIATEMLNSDGTAASSINPYVFLTDSAGQYRIPIDPDPPAPRFQVLGIDGQRCGRGSTTQTDGNLDLMVPSGGNTVTAKNIKVAIPPIVVANAETVESLKMSATPSRPGISNGGFELGRASDCYIGNFLNPQISALGIHASEGLALGYSPILSSGTFGTVQNVLVPDGVQTLSFDYLIPSNSLSQNYLSVYVTQANANTVFDDRFSFLSGDFIGGNVPIAFGGSGAFAFHTGSVNVSAFAGSMNPVSILFFFVCPGCSTITTPINPNNSLSNGFLDNIRFSTVLIDVKILQGSMTDLGTDAARFERVRQMVRDANETLAQVGVNVRISRLMTNATAVDERGESLTHPCPGTLNQPSLLNLPIGAPPTPNTSLQGTLGLCRSGVSTDVNVYFVNSFTNDFFGATNGIAVGPDDYTLTGTPGAGVIIRNIDTMMINDPDGDPLMRATLSTARENRKREVLAHELGHLLIGGTQGGSSLEHGALAGNLMSNNRCTPPPPTLTEPDSIPCSSRPIMTPAQSQQIHATNGGGFLVP